jgi:hypothetical protein
MANSLVTRAYIFAVINPISAAENPDTGTGKSDRKPWK